MSMSLSSTEHKECTKCGRVLPLESFSRDKSKKCGRRPSCKECASKQKRRFYEANRESITKKNREWRESNREKVRESKRRYHIENRDVICKRSRAWYKNNTERARANNERNYIAKRDQYLVYKQMHYIANRETYIQNTRNWQERNPDKVGAYSKNAKARRRAREGSAVVDVSYDAILARDGYVCYLCGGSVEPADIHFDHVIPLSRGGDHTEDNIAVTHSACNISKRNKTPGEYWDWLEFARGVTEGGAET